MNTPVAYIIFNRPRHTYETFAAIRAQRPTKLFVIADGPRLGVQADVERCREVRSIVEFIDWPCEVHRNYSDQNLGCKQRVISGLDWVFEQVDRAIVLEDDCLPHPDFFVFCSELLKKYASDPRVWTITGNNFQDGRVRGNASYYFSKYVHVWGWATWRRSWINNSAKLSFWPEWKVSEDWRRHTPDLIERNYWAEIFDRMYRNEIDTWDYPWLANVWYHNGLTATPNMNLVTNIGFGPEGTHTVTDADQKGEAVYPLGVLKSPQKVVQNRKADRYVFNHRCGGLNKRWPNSSLSFIKRVLGKVVRAAKGGA